MKKIFFFVIALFSLSIAKADLSPDWYRYASISPDGTKIAFVYKGDIYTVDVNGGEAKALTLHTAHDFMPVWNHDGSKIAFASERYGNFDVFVINPNGGKAKRLTYHSANEYPYTFTRDNKNVFFGSVRLDAASSRQYPHRSQKELYSVPVDGGRVDQVWTIPAEDIKINKNSTQYVYHDIKGGEDEFRKHHKSSVTRDIWVYDTASKKHKMISKFEGEDRNPVYSVDEKDIFYLSEESGCFNVHKMSLANPSKNTQITKFEKHPVRYLSMSNDGTLCYTHNGDLFIMKNNKQTKINVKISNDAKENNLSVISVRGNVSEMAISPNGKEVAYIVRGEVFVSGVDMKMTKRITNTPAEEQFVSFTPDGKGIIYASERNAKWGIYKSVKADKSEPYFFASTIIKEEKLIVNENENYQPRISPDGKELAFIENKTNLKIFNLASKKTRTILDDKSLYYMSDGDQYFRWSPDSKWLLVEYSPVLANTEAVLISAKGDKEMINLTESGYGDYSPIWVNGGKQMLWFSDRHGMRSYANSGSRQMDVYTMYFTKDAWEKMKLSKDEYALLKEIEKKKKEDKKKDADKDSKKSKKKKDSDKKKKESVKNLEFDWNGMKDRRKRLTIHSSRLSDACLSKDGETLYYIAKFDKSYSLWSTTIRTKETKKLMGVGSRGGSLIWDKDMKNLYMLASGTMYKLNLAGKSKKPISVNSEMSLDLAAERQQMFDHVWRRNKSMFYISDYHGADWDALGENYKAKLNSIGNDFEFAQLLSEMLGELNVSHSGARYYGGISNGDRTASLGIFIDYDYKDKGIKIAEIMEEGPLDRKALNVDAGMIITKIDGIELDGKYDYAKYLNRKQGKLTALEIFDPIKKKTFTITMKPVSLRMESGLRYRRWIKQNEEEVERLSDGKLAYVHIPGMNDGAYRNTIEKVLGKYYDKQALIVDTRFNGGGDLVGDITMFLTGENFMQYAIESRPVGYEPGYRWTKPSLAMINESNYSDGHCFSCAYKDLAIGKMVGMPVPGTCSFAGWEMLQNGNVLWGSIPVSAKNKAGEWLENNQTEPDIKVKNMPGFIDKGVDQQLEAAIKELLKECK
ncbi:MAG: S41 family peptidase [Marinifilaceae bacterium]|jgi:Tol biopolymer transport system component/C-terminal processing protease CtpA/Prc|nr:S41 family peptidase [Marinifilaceae bacterium]